MIFVDKFFKVNVGFLKEMYFRVIIVFKWMLANIETLFDIGVI